MYRSTAILLFLLLAAAAGGYAIYSQKGSDVPAMTPALAPGPAATQPTPEGPVVTEPLAPPETSADKAPGYIAYPDGTFFPPLNGVKVAPKLQFHPRMAPFSKVVGKEKDITGRVWYVHENGVRSTTYVNAAGLSTYEVMKPVDPQPILPEELPGGTGK